MRRALAKRLAVLLLAGGLPACVAPPQDAQQIWLEAGAVPEEQQPPGYLKARWLDLLDIFSLRVTFGPGLGARAGVTKLLQAGALAMGPADSVGSILAMPAVSVGTFGREVGMWDVRSAELGIKPFYVYQEDVRSFGDSHAVWRGAPEDRSAGAIDATVHLALIGASVAFEPLQLVDFFTGWFGVSVIDD